MVLDRAPGQVLNDDAALEIGDGQFEWIFMRLNLELPRLEAERGRVGFGSHGDGRRAGSG